VVCGRVGHELEVVGRVLVVAGHVERHHPLEKQLARFVVGEESVTVHIVQLALGRVGKPGPMRERHVSRLVVRTRTVRRG
jgi:hypothetical protein